MAEVGVNAITILQVLAEIRDVAEGIQENDEQAHRLSERVKAIQPGVLAVKYGKKGVSPESLRQLLKALEAIRSFLHGYSRSNFLNRVWRRRSNASRFRGFSYDLSEGMQALQMDVLVDVWAKQDVSDRLEDIGNLKHAMRSGERNSNENRAEFSRALTELEKDERSELNELSAWVEIDYDTDLDFEGSIRLGSGSFGEVTTAKWNGSHVAVKYLREDDNRDLVRAIRKEIRTHASLRFDHVVQLYAASTIAPNLCMVMEYASEGSLWQHLHSTRKPLAHPLQAAFLFDIARGMMFLHKKGILHRDLKSANVLVFANRRLKLCDFGLSKVMAESSSGSKRGPVGTSPWMSPEEINGSAATKLTDVYSFGVVCYEVATRMEPFRGMMPVQVMRAVADMGRRPEIPAGASASPDVVPLMERCWKQDPAQRPEGFAPVVEELCRVVGHLGDPRHHRSAANDITSSLGVKDSGGSAARVAANTAPLTASDDLGASPLDTTSVQKPMAATAPTSKVSVQDAATDRAVLMALYFTTNGLPEMNGIVGTTNGGWNRRNGWGTSRPIGEWHGVTVGENGRVIRLELTGNNLRGPIPEELCELTALTVLYLDHNQLSGPIPAGLGELKALTSLALYENQLSGPIPPSLGGLKLLTYLGLHDNKLTGPIPAELGGLTALTSLGLAQNQLSGPIPPSLGGLKLLTYLGLFDNKLTGLIPAELGGLTALGMLSLDENQLSGPIPAGLGELKALTRLDLSKNQLSGPIPPSLGRLKLLSYLGLHGNKLTGLIPAELGGLTALETLGLERNQLGGPIPSQLGELTALTVLHLHHNQLSGPIPAGLGGLTALTSLGLYENQLSGPIPPSLGGLKLLTYLGLYGNKLTGPIPAELGGLTALEKLSLERNQLSGPIPTKALGGLTALTKLWLPANILSESDKADVRRMLPNCSITYA